MVNVTFVRPNADGGTVLDCDEGQTLMEAATFNGVGGIDAECGGTLSCATCHVYISDDDLHRTGAPGPEEAEMLEFIASPKKSGSRLSCQIVVTEQLDGIVIHIPEEQ